MNKKDSKYQTGDDVEFYLAWGSNYLPKLKKGKVVDFYYMDNDLALKKKGFTYLVLYDSKDSEKPWKYSEVHESFLKENYKHLKVIQKRPDYSPLLPCFRVG